MYSLDQYNSLPDLVPIKVTTVGSDDVYWMVKVPHSGLGSHTFKTRQAAQTYVLGEIADRLIEAARLLIKQDKELRISYEADLDE